MNETGSSLAFIVVIGFSGLLLENHATHCHRVVGLFAAAC